MVGLLAIKWENAEVSAEFNDPVHNEYMALGVSIKGGDLAVTHTDGRGSEFGFTVETADEIEAKVALSNMEPGTKTSLYIDVSDDFPPHFSWADASITSTQGSKGLSASVEVPGVEVKGSAAVLSTAEGTAEFESEVEVTTKIAEKGWKYIPITKNNYKFKAPLSE
jgi:hypothetical protein